MYTAKIIKQGKAADGGYEIDVMCGGRYKQIWYPIGKPSGAETAKDLRRFELEVAQNKMPGAAVTHVEQTSNKSTHSITEGYNFVKEAL